MRTTNVISLGLIFLACTVSAQSKLFIYTGGESNILAISNNNALHKVAVQDPMTKPAEILDSSPDKIMYDFFGRGQSIEKEVLRVVGIMTNKHNGKIIQILNNDFSVVLPHWVSVRNCSKDSSIGIPLNILDHKDHVEAVLNILAQSQCWGDLYVVNAWGNYIFCSSGHDEKKHILALRGKVLGLAKRKVRSLEVIGVKSCLLGETNTVIDDSGRYLSTIEIFLVVDSFSLGNESYVYRTQTEDLAAIKWKINGELISETPLTNIVLNAINDLDIYVK